MHLSIDYLNGIKLTIFEDIEFQRKKGAILVPEKCFDIAFATQMLYFTAIPYAYDVAVAVAGDRYYIPVF